MYLTSSLPLLCSTFYSVFLLPLPDPFIRLPYFLCEKTIKRVFMPNQWIYNYDMTISLLFYRFVVIISLKETSTLYRYKKLENNTDPFYTHHEHFPLSKDHWKWKICHYFYSTDSEDKLYMNWVRLHILFFICIDFNIQWWCIIIGRLIF